MGRGAAQVVSLLETSCDKLFGTAMTSFAFVFPGQGSQSVGMLDAWGDNPVVAQTLAEASDAMGEDVGKLIHEGPKEALALTTNTQPVMLVAAVAAYRVWLAEGGAKLQWWRVTHWVNTLLGGFWRVDTGASRSVGAFPCTSHARSRACGHGCDGGHLRLAC